MMPFGVISIHLLLSDKSDRGTDYSMPLLLWED